MNRRIIRPYRGIERHGRKNGIRERKKSVHSLHIGKGKGHPRTGHEGTEGE